MMRRLPVSTHTLYADIVDRAWTGSYQEIVRAGGSPFRQTVKGRDYWYLKMPMVNGKRRPNLYLGPDSLSIRARISEHKALKDIRRERMDMIRALRAARLPGPDPISGKILSALSEAGAFRMRAVVVGSAAFQTYSPMLGVRFDDAGQTSDLNLAQFHAISIAIGDSIPDDFLTTLQAVDGRFSAILSPIDGRRTLRYAIRTGSEEEFSVDLLSSLRDPERGQVTALPALKGDAQLLRYLDFLIYSEVNAVSLYGAGIPINVPAPERYAIHKLIVSRQRIDTAASQAKARKDIRQAEALIEVLIEDKREDVRDAWNEALARGEKWRAKLLEGASSLRENIRSGLTALTDPDVGRTGAGVSAPS